MANKYGDPLTPADKTVIVAMCKNDLKPTKAAVEAHYNLHGLYYRIEQIIIKTGLDCRKFFDAVQLLEMTLEYKSPVVYVEENEI